jgi:hypothetical protein
MPSNPLTHHEILTLVEPFTQRGRQVDLAATDRAERRLVFKPRERESRSLFAPALTETLVLENPGRDDYRLIRTLTTGSGEEASLRVDGRDPGSLLERLDRIAPQVHFQHRRGVTIARNYRLYASPSKDPGAPPRDDLVLREATADLGDVLLNLDSATGAGAPAEVWLMPKPERPFDPPEDLLAVLGWRWRPLRRHRAGWRSLLRVARREPRRTRDCERRLERAVDHLALTLREPPARFHARFPVARWVCLGRRIAAILVVLGLLAAGPLILWSDLPNDSVWRMLAFNSPPFLLFAVFAMREMPNLRPPGWPRPLPETAWVPPPQPGASLGGPAADR